MLIMCLSVGKSAGESVRGLGWRTCCRMAGEETFGYFRLSEGTEGEDEK